MPDDVARLLQEIGTATSMDELATLACTIDVPCFDEWAIALLTDAIREARERLEPNR